WGFAGWVTAVKSSGLAAALVALASTGIAVGTESSAIVAMSSAATGGSLTGVTVTVTVAVAAPPLPSLIVYVNVAVPLKFGAGWKVRPVPPPVITTVPPAGWVTAV